MAADAFMLGESGDGVEEVDYLEIWNIYIKSILARAACKLV